MRVINGNACIWQRWAFKLRKGSAEEAIEAGTPAMGKGEEGLGWSTATRHSPISENA